MIRRLFFKIRKLLYVNWINTIITNFRLLPFKQALHLPIYCYGNVSILISSDRGVTVGSTKKGSIQIGSFNHRVWGRNYHKSLTKIMVKGKLHIGHDVKIGNGCIIVVEPYGDLSIGNDVEIGFYSRFFCQEKMVLGNQISVSWDCQIFDTDFHYMVDENRIVKKCTKPVIIGDNVWIGNRVTVSKGSVIDDNSIIGSNSLVNSDLKNKYGEGIFVGIPVRKLPVNKRRIFNLGTEKKINEYFAQNNAEIEYFLESTQII